MAGTPPFRVETNAIMLPSGLKTGAKFIPSEAVKATVSPVASRCATIWKLPLASEA